MELEQVLLQVSGHKDFRLAATSKRRVQLLTNGRTTMALQREDKMYSHEL